MTAENIRMIGRAILVWLVIIAAEFVHGTLRVIFLEPRVGDFRARQLAVFSGMLIIFAISFLSVRKIRAANYFQLFLVGLLWVGLTAAFEILLGSLMNLPRERIFSDYDIGHGGLLGFGLLFMLFAPTIAAGLRNRLSRRRAINS